MNVGLDFDGVIADGARLKSAVLKQAFDIDIAPVLCKRKYALQEGWVSEERYEEMLCAVYEDWEMHALIPPIPEAVESIRGLMDDGHHVRIISARDPAAERNVLPWLEQHGIVMPVVCVGRFGEKTEACRGLDAYVDDDLVHLLPLKRVVPRKFLFGPQPGLNQHWLAHGIRRVQNWRTLLPRLHRPAHVA
jgi:hypothetical protein